MATSPWLVMAGKGGVGTTTVTALLAEEAGLQGLSTLVVDGNLGSPGLHRSFGQLDGHPGMRSLTERGRKPEELLLAAGHNVWLMPAGMPEYKDAVLDQGGRAGVLRRARSLFDRFDMVLLDAGSTLESIVPTLQLDPRGVCLVLQPERTAMAGAYALVKVLRDEAPNLATVPILNRTPVDRAEAVQAAMIGATVRFLGTRMAHASHIPRLPQLDGGSVSSPLTLGHMQTDETADEAAAAVRQILNRLTSQRRASA
ncbi:MAG: hypothetical protein HKN73_11605 [Gemmatimonadetes bacterium]|nr:hypothetical protein [Gemmatimonadota bacterium]